MLYNFNYIFSYFVKYSNIDFFKDEKHLKTSSTSRSQSAPNPALSTSIASSSNQGQKTSQHELKRGTSTQHSRDEEPMLGLNDINPFGLVLCSAWAPLFLEGFSANNKSS